ncbi:MAG: thioredoxin family protein [Luminiphilus sp.]|nr:thioredoxin family protein [Luminiphilus sp.]
MTGKDAKPQFTRHWALSGCYLLMLMGIFLFSSPHSQSQNSLAAALQQQSEFLPVREAYRLDGAITPQGELRLYWQITQGYYLYQHAFRIRSEAPALNEPLSIALPLAMDKTDEFFGEVSVYYDEADLTVRLPDDPQRLTLAVTYQGCADAGLCYPPETEYLLVDVSAGSVSPTERNAASLITVAAPPAPASGAADMTLMLAIGLAFLGGVILNAMPCVFPILSLKVLSFATGDPGEHRRHGLAYLAGVVCSFVAIAGLLISLQSAGRWVGWGFQLQSTGFVMGLAYLFALMGLSLSGLVLLGNRWMNLGAGLASAPGMRGSFFTGVLAVVVASPCTAPFMGSALGFALTQPPVIALMIFAALGVGMAAPMMAISSSATARSWLPKPGAWMDTLKQVMAFPLYLTAVWLLWVAGKQSGVDTMAAGAAGLVLLALGLTMLRGGTTAKAVGVAALVGAVLLGGVRGTAQTASDTSLRPGVVNWSPESLQSLRALGTPVFVDVTADWCITCLANEQAVLFTDEMELAFADAGVTYMVADWTHYDAAIGEFVQQHGRNGIPLYVLYAGDLQTQPVILPQLLTRSIMMDALASVRR